MPPAWRGGPAWAAVLGSLVACSPTMDWRQMQPEGWNLSVALPCRPASHARAVPLAGTSVELTLMACSAEGHTYAIASASLTDPAAVPLALQALGQAARANVQGVVESERPAQVPGMTPQAQALQWRLRGQLPGGAPVTEQAMVFAHGLRVFQATVVGPQADDVLARSFFEKLEVRP